MQMRKAQRHKYTDVELMDAKTRIKGACAIAVNQINSYECLEWRVRNAIAQNSDRTVQNYEVKLVNGTVYVQLQIRNGERYDIVHLDFPTKLATHLR